MFCIKHTRNTINAFSFRIEMSVLQNHIFHVTLIARIKTTVRLIVKIKFFFEWCQWWNGILIH